MANVSDYMKENPITVKEDQTMRDVVEIFRMKNIRHLPVLQAGGDILVGIVTDRDVKKATPSLLQGIDQEEYERIMDATPVNRIMTRDPLAVNPGTSLKDAATLIMEKKIGGLPVVDNDQLVGVITYTDCLRALIDKL